MKNLLFTLLLFCCSLLGAQCNVQVFTPDVTCIGLDSISFSYYVTGPAGGTWFSPQLDVGGEYGQEILRTSPTLANWDVDTIFWIDQADPTCFVARTIPDFGCDDDNNGCGNFSISATMVPGEDCGASAETFVTGTSAFYPIFLRLESLSNNNSTQLDTLFTETDTVRFLGLVDRFYTVRGTDAGGCVGPDEFLITDFQSLDVGFELRLGSCIDNSFGSAVVVVPGTGPYTYAWSTGETTQQITGRAGVDEYVVTVTNTNSGCTGVGTVFAEELAPNAAPREMYEFTVPCGADSVLVVPDTIREGFTYRWESSIGDTIEASSFMSVGVRSYSFEATNAAGCVISGSAVVTADALEDNFVNLFPAQFDTTCEATTCILLETTIRQEQFDDGTFSLLWEGPGGDIERANDVGLRALCTETPGTYRLTISGPCDTVSRTATIQQPRGCSDISGTLYLDAAGDCALSAEDPTVAEYLLTVTEVNTGETYYTLTNDVGEWLISVPLGEYVIQPNLLPNAPFTVCVPPVSVSLGGSSVAGVEVFLPATSDCAQLTTNVVMPFLRRCFESRAFVEYNNTGSVPANDAILTVELDPFFVGVTATPAPSRVNGNVYEFDLGDVSPFNGGRVVFDFTISCDAELGQAHCVEASIFPDKPCISTGQWNGALVSVEPMGCDGDSVYFNVRNIGLEQMTVPLSYVIVEDGIMLNPEPVVNGLLQPEEEMLIAALATGGTFHLITNQEPDAPGSNEPTAVVEGCRGPGNVFSTGFTGLLPLSAGPNTTSVVCLENVGSYDPNDKRGFPLGYGVEGNEIAYGTTIDYNIRFQNTGTDTAFTVVIRDTLPTTLDLATLEIGAASHPFTVSVDSHRVLTFTFNDILLPDSTTNLAASQGGVTFSLEHDTLLGPGASIRNEAAIYFDFNEPIITNVSEHLIAKEGLPVGVRRALAQELAVTVFPNPANGEIRVTLPGVEGVTTRRVRITDLYGRVMTETSYAEATTGINVRSLSGGYYLAVVTDAQGRARGRAGFVVAR